MGHRVGIHHCTPARETLSRLLGRLGLQKENRISPPCGEVRVGGSRRWVGLVVLVGGRCKKEVTTLPGKLAEGSFPEPPDASWEGKPGFTSLWGGQSRR